MMFNVYQEAIFSGRYHFCSQASQCITIGVGADFIGSTVLYFSLGRTMFNVYHSVVLHRITDIAVEIEVFQAKNEINVQ